MRKIQFKVINNQTNEVLGSSWCYESQLETIQNIFNSYNSKIEVE